MSYHTPENVERVGRAFLEELTAWFRADGVEPTAEHIEHGNDHYDANMAMDAALRKTGVLEGDDLPLEDQTLVDLFNDAWTRAVELRRAMA